MMTVPCFVRRVVIFIVLIISFDAIATMVSSEPERCPVCQNTVRISRMASWGPYIYDDPSKYDLIYAPKTYTSYFATCNQCGYSQNVHDFLELTEAQIQSLKSADYMTSWKPTDEKIPFGTRLQRALLVNETLDKNEEFWARFNRIRIFHMREIDPAKASELAKIELDLIDYDTHLFRKQKAYLHGEYNRLAGNTQEAKRLLEQAASISIVGDMYIGMALIILVAYAVVAAGIYLFKRNKYVVYIAKAMALMFTAVVILIGNNRTPHFNQIDDYNNQIIEDRIALLKETKEANATTTSIENLN